MKKIVTYFTLIVSVAYSQEMTGNDYLAIKQEGNVGGNAVIDNYVSGIIWGLASGMNYSKTVSTRKIYSLKYRSYMDINTGSWEKRDAQSRRTSISYVNNWANNYFIKIPEGVNHAQMALIVEKWIKSNPEITHVPLAFLCLASVIDAYGGEEAKAFMNERIKEIKKGD